MAGLNFSLFKKEQNKCFCAFCKSPRRVEAKKHVNWINVLLSAMVSLVLMWTLWFEVNPKAVILFVMCLVVSEIFLQIRWRLSLACPHCQFDPLLYIKSPERASERVRRHFDSIQETPSYVMGYHPLQRRLRDSKKKVKDSRGRATLSRKL